MPTQITLASGIMDQLRNAPAHEVLIELSRAAMEAKILPTAEFKKLVAYVLEQADGRDRREPWTTRPGVVRPIPKLRVQIEKCFGVYADVHWFKLNKTTNSSGLPLNGLFPRMAASLWRIKDIDFAAMVKALLSSAPDAALLRLLHEHGGKIRGMGVEVFSRLAFAYRRDLYFVIPKPWGDTSGCLKFIGDDLRKYCGLCRNLRAVCDALGVAADVRGSVFQFLLQQPKPPAELLEALHKAIGPSLARYSALDPADAYQAKSGDDHESALPMEFAANAIRRRRGQRSLREALSRAYGDRCAIAGACIKDLLEVAYVVPFPSGDVHSTSNALLLRADLHTLWDLNMLAIEPKSQKVHVAPNLKGTSYEKLSGRALTPRRDGSRVNAEALRDRWRMFVNAHAKVKEGDEKPASPKRPAKKAAAHADGKGAEPPVAETVRPSKAGEKPAPAAS